MAMSPTAEHMLLLSAAFIGGLSVVWALQRRSDVRAISKKPAGGTVPVISRPASHIRVQSFEEIVAATSTSSLLDSIERRTRLSQKAYNSDCLPVLRLLAEFVQMLPASESHHHAQPGGLWIHMLEVADAALAFRAGLELPRGVGTEDRKRLEHRCTYMVFIGALLHDVGKPVADLRVTVFPDDPRLGKPWAALAGPMEVGQYYRVEFAPKDEREYQLHQRLPAILAQRFVPEHTIKWLGDEPQLLGELFKYLSSEDAPQSFLPDIVRQADAASVKRNLASGPRTRFATAKVVPLIERLMQGLRRMLAQGGLLPLNKPGAVGWVYDGAVWFVCARLADEIRDYLAQHESAEGIPSAAKNDRIFDEFQDYGACESNPDGSGAVWKIEVELEVGWKSPPLTVLKFPLVKLFGADQSTWPSPIVGSLKVLGSASKAAAANVVVAPAQTSEQGTGAVPQLTQPAAVSNASSGPAVKPLAQPLTTAGAAIKPVPVQPGPAITTVPSAGESAVKVEAPQPKAKAAPTSPQELPHDLAQSSSSLDMMAMPPDEEDAPAETVRHGGLPQPEGGDTDVAEPGKGPVSSPQPSTAQEQSDQLNDGEGAPFLREEDQADLSAMAGAPRQTAKAVNSVPLAMPVVMRDEAIAAPQQPHQKLKKSPRPAKDATPAATAFFVWLQTSVATGHLKYNEPQALVHFVPEGMLLLSPGVFRRFLEDHDGVESGPVAALKQTYGEKVMHRLQNEVAKSPYTLRNGDENLHYYAFTKHDGGISATSSFFLVPQPQLFFNPVPALNSRIVKTGRPARKLKPVGAQSKT